MEWIYILVCTVFVGIVLFRVFLTDDEYYFIILFIGGVILLAIGLIFFPQLFMSI